MLILILTDKGVFSLRDWYSSPLSESLPKEEERYTRSPARITYSFKRLARIRRIFLDGYGVLRCQNSFFKCLRLSSRMLCYESSQARQDHQSRLSLTSLQALKETCKSSIELEYNIDQCYNALTDQLDWTNPEGDRCLYNLSKPLSLQGSPCHLTIHVDFFFNNDLEYSRTRNSERKYIVSITKTKAARYELKFIEDMIPRIWIPVKVAYDKDDTLGISHWGPKRQLFYRSQINRLSRHDVFSTMKILSVNKLYNLEGSDIVDMAVVLCMFTQSLVIKKRVEDVQFSIESYQKKLNITKPQKDFPGISTKEPYTTSHDRKGVVYLNSSKRERLMQADEIYKEQAKYNETNAYVLEDSILQAGNPVMEIFLKLNLPDHMSVLTEPEILTKVEHDTVFAAMLKYASRLNGKDTYQRLITLEASKLKKVIKDRGKKEKMKEFRNAKNPQCGRIMEKKNHGRDRVLPGSVKAAIVRILAGKTIKFAAMTNAYALAFSIYNLSEPLRFDGCISSLDNIGSVSASGVETVSVVVPVDNTETIVLASDRVRVNGVPGTVIKMCRDRPLPEALT
ncbi:hypothetical protein Tco_0774672 [Tanacetum coccineum]|uniref:Uncharacterized protein n=1 Tax=Tanacetum coccineum TaxID=301880 RepID=A0ABQ4ZRE0_9ASTR